MKYIGRVFIEDELRLPVLAIHFFLPKSWHPHTILCLYLCPSRFKVSHSLALLVCPSQIELVLAVCPSEPAHHPFIDVDKKVPVHWPLALKPWGYDSTLPRDHHLSSDRFHNRWSRGQTYSGPTSGMLIIYL